MNPIVFRRLFVKPATGRRVVNPETNRVIPAEGELVLDNKYFRRRIAQGDVVEATQPEVINTTKTKNSSKKEN